MGVAIKYKGSTIASMNADGTKTLKTAGKYCEGDIGVEYSAPTPTLISKSINSNGTYTAAKDNADGYREVTVNVKSGIPIDEDSLTPLAFGIDSDGFYFSDTPADETPVSFGRDSSGIYVVGGETT